MAGEKKFLVRGSAAGIVDDRPIEEQKRSPRGRYRGLLEAGDVGKPGRSVFWTKSQQDVVLTESALRECQADPMIVVVVLREVSDEEAAKIAAGEVAAAQAEQLGGLSDEALEAELVRRGKRAPGKGGQAQASAGR
jgi:hypothetical protein